jgi:hypothetical protein
MSYCNITLFSKDSVEEDGFLLDANLSVITTVITIKNSYSLHQHIGTAQLLINWSVQRHIRKFPD